jgi:hypothetical protein
MNPEPLTPNAAARIRSRPAAGSRFAVRRSGFDGFSP